MPEGQRLSKVRSVNFVKFKATQGVYISYYFNSAVRKSSTLEPSVEISSIMSQLYSWVLRSTIGACVHGVCKHAHTSHARHGTF
jgi:hypothetical protein